MAWHVATAAAAEVRYASFPSASLGRDVGYAVQLPPSYATGDRRYPVLYVLHGLFESPAFWEERGLPKLLGDLWTSGDVPEMVVVAVDGDNSFFVDGPLGAYERLVTRDLVAHVEATYRATPGRDGRALLGISMGGYAALRIALSRPELFRAAIGGGRGWGHGGRYGSRYSQIEEIHRELHGDKPQSGGTSSTST